MKDNAQTRKNFTRRELADDIAFSWGLLTNVNETSLNNSGTALSKAISDPSDLSDLSDLSDEFDLMDSAVRPV